MFETHKLNEKGFDEVRTVKAVMFEAVEAVMALMPEGREKAIFKRKIEEAMFYGTKSVASKDGNFSEIITFKPGNA